MSILRDGIPSLDEPAFVGPSDADAWLGDPEPVIVPRGGGAGLPAPDTVPHEIVNDLVGGVPVAVTFCPLCNSAIVMDRRVDGDLLTFGVSVNLRNSDLTMWDRQTETWWQQFTGEAIVGALAGKLLKIIPATITAYEDFKALPQRPRALPRYGVR